MTKHQAERIFSFSSWAKDHPSEQIPGDRVDLQFDNHRLAIETLAQSVQRLLRADGKLNHDLLTIESLPKALVHDMTARARREIEAFATPLLDSVQGQHSRLEAFQLSILAELDETKALNRDAQRVNAHVQGLSEVVDRRVQQALVAIAQALDVNTNILNDVNWAALQAATAQDWAQVAIEWAEHMPDTIPPNILATNAISGEHWSSRWWAMRSANAFGMLAWWYMGAWPGPPPTTPLTPTGQPIPPGAMYFDTVTGKMYVWNGSTWISPAQGPARATTSSLYYPATAGQTVFPLSVNDRYGHIFAFNQTATEGLQALVNGVRLEPTVDFTVDTVASSVTFLRPLPAGAIATFDILTPTTQLIPSGTVNTVLLSPIVPDGVKTNFTGLTVASNGHPVNVAKNEELLVSVDGVQQQPGVAYNASAATITFIEAPASSANIFVVWFGPENP